MPEEDQEIIEALREVILQMEGEDPVDIAAEERAAEHAARNAGVPGVIDPLKRIQGQLSRDDLRNNMPPPRRRDRRHRQ